MRERAIPTGAAKSSDPPSFILTGELDEESAIWLDGLRRRHFPPDRNVLSAHLTLFHKLSLEDLGAVTHLSMPPGPVAVHFPGLRLLGNGVAVEVSAPKLETVRRSIASKVSDLTPQDQQGWRPHVTIQNKVTSDEAKLLFGKLAASFNERQGTVRALLIWEYVGGPWRFDRRLPFA